MLTDCIFCVIIFGGDNMNQNFIITGIKRVILVGKNEYPEIETRFTGAVTHNELIFHFGGKATVYFNGKTMQTDKNTIRFLPKGENKEYVVKRESEGECIDVFFDTDVPLSDEAFVISLQDGTNIGNMFKNLFSKWVSKNDGYYFDCISLLYKIFAEMQKQRYISKNQYNLIKPAIEHIEENFLKSKISIPYLAKKCGISEAYLKKLFIKNFNISPVKYIIQLKINYACDLLRLGRYTVSQISDFCGYDSVYYFSRQFKKYMGISPSVFVSKYISSK